MVRFVLLLGFLGSLFLFGDSYWQHANFFQFHSVSSSRRVSSDSPFILTKPNTVGNFVDPYQISSFLQCLILGTTSIDGIQYGVGMPLHTPVMLLTLNEQNKLIEVAENYSHYDHLIESISAQLESYDLLLHRTPIYLTVEGEFEEDETILENQIEDDDDDDDDDSEEEISIDSLTLEHSSILTDSSRDNEDEEEDDPLEEEGQAESEDSEGVVSRESSQSLYRESRFVDKIMEFAKDVKYVGSFHYRKRNYHMIRLLDVS